MVGARQLILVPFHTFEHLYAASFSGVMVVGKALKEHLSQVFHC